MSRSTAIIPAGQEYTLATVLILFIASWEARFGLSQYYPSSFTDGVDYGDTMDVLTEEYTLAKSPDFVDVIKYGAIGDGITDDAQAFLKAWRVVCGSSANAPILNVPEGKIFKLGPLNFRGPCKSSSVVFQLRGAIVAPLSIGEWRTNGNQFQAWLRFSYVNGLTMRGTGRIDGRGKFWWNGAYNSNTRPTALAFDNCNNLRLSGLTHRNSPRAHISITGCTDVTISNIYIAAPASSPNTDGIDISQSSRINISYSRIATGDDCVAINEDSSFIYVTSVDCGPGHGISVGSLGKDGRAGSVEEVHVKNCIFRGTSNGARIKTWQGGSGSASKISYEDIKLYGAANPIIIDQYYCNGEGTCPNKTSAVRVSDVTFNRVYGTSSTDVAIDLSCSQSLACSNIVLTNINIRPANSGSNLRATCLNAHGRVGNIFPPVNCLLP